MNWEGEHAVEPRLVWARDRLAWSLHTHGLTYKEIGHALEISTARAVQLAERHDKRLRTIATRQRWLSRDCSQL